MSSLVKKAKYQFAPNYIAELRVKTGYYIGYIPNYYADQPTADSFYELIRKDAEINRCLSLLALMAAGERVEVETRNQTVKSITQWALRQTRGFLHTRKSLVEKGVLFGMGIQRKYYCQRKNLGIPWEVCYRCQEVDRRRIRIERDEENRNNLYYTLWSPIHDGYIVLEDRADNPEAPDGAAIQDYIWYHHNQEELSPYSEGLGEILYFLAYIKKLSLEYWSDFNERWSRGLLVASVDVLQSTITKSLGSGYATMSDRVNALLDTFEKVRSKHVAVIDQNDQLKMLEAGTAGQNLVREMIEYADKQIQLNIIGSELATNAAGVGSYALGSVHKEPLMNTVKYNRNQVSEALVFDYIYDFFYRNRKQLAYFGLSIPDYGEINLKIRLEKEDLQEQLEAEQATAGQRPVDPNGGRDNAPKPQ